MGNLTLVLLCFILFAWTPVNFAAEVTATLPSIEMRGPLAIVELCAHGAAAVLSVAAGWSLWNGRAHAPGLARLALVMAAGVSVQSVYWSLLPRQTPPGSELPLAALAVAHAALWLLYLQRSARIRAMAAG